MFLHGHADLRERDLLDRPDLGAAPGRRAAVRARAGAWPASGWTTCRRSTSTAASRSRSPRLRRPRPRARRPARAHAHRRAAVLRRRRQQLLAARDRRGRPARAAAAPGTLGLVGANGGIAVQVLGGRLRDHARRLAPDRQRRPAGRARRAARGAVADRAPGRPGTDRDLHRHARPRRPRTASSSAASRPTAAASWPPRVAGDDDARSTCSLGEPTRSAAGLRAVVRLGQPGDARRRAAHGRAAAPAPAPRLPRGLRARPVRRDGHVLEVTIDRPEARNALHPPANDELDEVFDAYFADDPTCGSRSSPAPATGVLARATTCATRVRQADVDPPKNGFAGLTARRDDQAGDRRGERLRAGRRVRDRDGLPPRRRRRVRVVRADRGQGRARRGRGRGGAAAADRRPAPGHRDDPDRAPAERLRGAGRRAGQPGDRRRAGPGRSPRAGRRDPGRLADVGPAVAADDGRGGRGRGHRRGGGEPRRPRWTS